MPLRSHQEQVRLARVHLLARTLASTSYPAATCAKGRCSRRCPVPISAAVTRAVLESSDVISLCPCRPGAPISPPPCKTHTSHTHTKKTKRLFFYCTCNEGRGGTRGTNAN